MQCTLQVKLCTVCEGIAVVANWSLWNLSLHFLYEHVLAPTLVRVWPLPQAVKLITMIWRKMDAVDSPSIHVLGQLPVRCEMQAARAPLINWGQCGSSTFCYLIDYHCAADHSSTVRCIASSSIGIPCSPALNQSRKLATSVAKPLLDLTRSQMRCFMASAVRCASLSHVWGSAGTGAALTLASRVTMLRPSMARAASTITEGAKLPDANLSYFDKEGNVHTVKVSDLTRAKTVVLFAVPGAFTPTCSTQHLPGFVAKAGELRKAGVDVLACVSVNDAFVMRAWGEQLNVGEDVLLLSDGLGSFTKALGATVDLSDKPVGLGVRSRRYSMLVEDGVVMTLVMEEGGAFTTSSAEEILRQLHKPKAAPNVRCSAGHSVQG